MVRGQATPLALPWAVVLLAVFLDRPRGTPARRRARYAVAALRMLPLLPQPSFAVTPDVALVAPFPPYHNRYGGGSYTRAMLWQAVTTMRYHTPEGYAFVAGPDQQAALRPPSVMQETVVAMQQGAPPRLTAPRRQGLLHDLHAWSPRTIIVGPMGNRGAMLHLFTGLLGRPSWHGGGVYVWWNALGQDAGAPCDLDGQTTAVGVQQGRAWQRGARP